MSALLAAAQTLAARFGRYGLVTTYRPPALSAGQRTSTMDAVLSDIRVAILMPARLPDMSLIASIGGERAAMIGFAPVGSDIRLGDEVRYSDIVMAVVGVQRVPDGVILGLSEESPRGTAFAPTTSSTTSGTPIGLTLVFTQV